MTYADSSRPQSENYTAGILSQNLPTELARLKAMEQMLDPEEIKALSGIGIQPGWRCLELGAGAGSITRWLAAQVPDGQVVATDVDTRFLDPSWAPNLEIRVHDLERDDFPDASFDLIHARALFMHLADREGALRKMVRWVRPGGWILVSEADMFPADHSPYPLMKHVWAGAERLFVAQGSNPRWGRTLPLVYERAGLTDVGMSVSIDVVGGGPGVTTDFWKASLAQAKPFLLDQKLTTPELFEEAFALLDDPAFLDTLWAYVRMWGRRPPD